MILGAITPKNQKDLRSSLHPNTLKPILDMGIDVIFESGLGKGIDVDDSVFSQMGAKPVSRESCISTADILMSSSPVSDDEISSMKDQSIFLGLMEPFANRSQFSAFQQNNVSAISMEFIPRITRAQKMDVLSSQSNLAGYVSVIESAKVLKSALPMMMTAAGTLKPATVFVIGVGVAGLQAIATAKRLGAVVSATDVRRAAGEQCESLGASFIMVDEEEDSEDSGGYAKEMSKDYQERQNKLISEHIKSQDIVICSALIPGKTAPILLTEEMVRSMKSGSVIVDMAIERGGNCALTKPNENAEIEGVTIIGDMNMIGGLAPDASNLYSRNLHSFLSLFIDLSSDQMLNWEDEIVEAVNIVKDSKISESFVK